MIKKHSIILFFLVLLIDSFFSSLTVAMRRHEEQTSEESCENKWEKQAHLIQKRLIDTYEEFGWLKNIQAQGREGWESPEFKRAVSSIISLHLLLDEDEKGAYQVFIAHQKKTIPFSGEELLILDSFKTLRALALKLTDGTKNKNMIQALELSLGLEHIGKTAEARLKAKNANVTIYDHHVFLEECFEKCPDIFPSYGKIEEPYQKLLINTKHVHFNHLIYAEGSPLMLTRFKGFLDDQTIKIDSDIFDALILTQILHNIAGRGHERLVGSEIYTDTLHQVMMRATDALKFLHSEKEEDAFRYYLTTTADAVGINSQGVEREILSKLACMMRFFTKEKAQLLVKAYQSLTESDKVLVSEHLLPFQYTHEKTPTYVPTVFSILLEKCKSEQALEHDAINVGILFFARTMKDYREGRFSIKYDPNLTISFAKIAYDGVAPAKSFSDALSVLTNHVFDINANGELYAEKIRV